MALGSGRAFGSGGDRGEAPCYSAVLDLTSLRQRGVISPAPGNVGVCLCEEGAVAISCCSSHWHPDQPGRLTRL